MRRDEGVGIRRVLEFEVASEIGRGRSPIGWKEQVEKDMVKAGYGVTMHRLGLHGDVGYLAFRHRQTNANLRSRGKWRQNACVCEGQ
jgi:hypothetical protein